MKYAVETSHGSIVCTDGETYKRQFIGPGTDHSARTWKSAVWAWRYAQRIGGRVISLTDNGTEWGAQPTRLVEA